MNKFLYILKERFDIQIKDEFSVLKYIGTFVNFDIDIVYAIIRIREEFGDDAEIILELKEICCGNTMLVIIVRQKIYSDNIMTILDKINSELEENMNEFSGWVLLTSDFHNITYF